MIGPSNKCAGPLGTCLENGSCEPDPKDLGCPCGDQYACNANPAANSCINQDRPCICDGLGTCAINYFPEGNACDGGFSNDCEVNRCLQNNDWYPDGDAITCQTDPSDTDGKLCLTDDYLRLVPNTPPYCMGVGGICNDTNTCMIQPLPKGSPCGSEPTECGGTADNTCVDPEQPCVCNGMGGCEVNYLQLGSGCDGPPPFFSDCVMKRYVLSNASSIPVTTREGSFTAHKKMKDVR